MLVLFIDIEIFLAIHAKYVDIDNVGSIINIETYYLTGTTMMFFIQIKGNI